MWQQLSTLAFCGTLAFGADVCNGLPTHPPAGTDFLAAPRPLAFRISVKPAGPSFRITLRPLLLKWQDGNSDPVHAGDIEVAGCQDGKLLQVLPITAWQPINFGSTFRTDDINFDGYLDFHVLTEFAGKYGSESYWVYDPANGRFAGNELTRELGENCLGTEWHGGCWKANSIEFDAKRHEISARYLVGVGQCGSPVDRYRLEANRLIVVHQEVLDMNLDGCTVTVSDRVAGSMRRTQVRRYDARGEPIK
jgi:hypothetical protein